jgi:uncharacterized YigZ family protein
MMRTQFQTIASPVIAESREKASKFIAYAFPIEQELAVQTHVDRLWKEHVKASHVCYAYRLGVDGALQRVNDDGEPSGTAGKPILGQLLSKDVSDVLICVVRYFGGTKLGASGLITAYKEIAKQVLEEATIIEKVLVQEYELSTSYEHMGTLLNELKSLDIDIASKSFVDDVKIIVSIPIDLANQQIKRLKARLLHYELDRIEEETIVPFCTFVPLQIVKK